MSKIYEALRQAEADRTKNGESHQSSVLTEELAPPPSAPRESSSRLLDTPTRFPSLSGEHDSAPTDAVSALALDLSQVPAVEWHPVLERLPSLEERGSAVEQFRSLRSRMHEFRDLNTLKSIMVSSGLPREGKSFVAMNLAVALARHKSSRVLLIDGDMRRATLHEMLGTAISPGLTEYLQGSASITEVMQRPRLDLAGAPIPAGLTSLTFMPAGKEHDKAADLSGNRRFASLMASVGPYFDWIVVDSSPVNLVSDGVNLSHSCDAVLMVARGGVTRYEVAQRAVAELKNSKVLGFVLNAVVNPPVAGGYYGYDGYDKVEA